MITSVISKKGIRFLQPAILFWVVSSIENQFPGWWWSISHRKDGWFGFTCGPGQNCPNPLDVEYSKTKKGDQGFDQGKFFTEEHTEKDFFGWLNHLIGEIDEKRNAFSESQKGFVFSPSTVGYRCQDVSQIKQLVLHYDDFLKEIDFFESHDRVLDELYLGSCDLSVDCSIRGTKADNTEFDISIDYLVGSIADALWDATLELKNDILTPKEEVEVT